jgi:hypothetical protein
VSQAPLEAEYPGNRASDSATLPGVRIRRSSTHAEKLASCRTPLSGNSFTNGVAALLLYGLEVSTAGVRFRSFAAVDSARSWQSTMSASA